MNITKSVTEKIFAAECWYADPETARRKGYPDGKTALFAAATELRKIERGDLRQIHFCAECLSTNIGKKAVTLFDVDSQEWRLGSNDGYMICLDCEQSGFAHKNIHTQMLQDGECFNSESMTEFCILTEAVEFFRSEEKADSEKLNDLISDIGSPEWRSYLLRVGLPALQGAYRHVEVEYADPYDFEFAPAFVAHFAGYILKHEMPTFIPYFTAAEWGRKILAKSQGAK